MTGMDAVFWGLASLLLVFSLLPLLKIPQGFLRGIDFPRQQFFIMALGLLAASAFFTISGRGLLGVTLAAVAAIQAIYYIKFTPIWRVQSLRAPDALLAQAGKHLSMLIANVKLSNRAYERLIDQTRSEAPDILLAIEVDQDWITALQKGLGTDYPHHIDVPKTTGYGMSVHSKLPLSDVQVRELITQGVPSIKTRVTLPSGDDVRLYVVHPEPPIISHDTKGRDSEIALIGVEAAKDPLPAIVTGDLNDVAWSTTTRRFQRLSGLLDPRVGRGFYNTFSATMPLMRWPLDHLFHDNRFRLIKMARLPKIGSDHFPLWFALALSETADSRSEVESAAPEERREVADMIKSEKNRDREAIGSDWEKG